MDGVHDLGGKEGHGRVVVEPDEPVFHDEWERRAFGIAMVAVAGGLSRGGAFRHAIERMDAVHYLTSRYYEHWLTAVATLLVETGVVAEGELEDRAGGPFPLAFPTATTGVTAPPPAPGDATLALGSRVTVRHVMTRGHTRCPAYVRGRTGTVVRVDPARSVPDVETHDSGPTRREPVYCVRFDARELWADSATPGASVHVDLWASYLEAV